MHVLMSAFLITCSCCPRVASNAAPHTCLCVCLHACTACARACECLQVAWIKKHINTGNVSSFCILLLVWITFCNTFGNKVIRTVPGGDVAGTVFLNVALFIMFVVVCFVVAWPPPPLHYARKLLQLTKPDVVAIVICGSTKTVAMGVPLISVMYKEVPYAGLLALPLIVYHALQVLLGGLLLNPLRRWCLAAPPQQLPTVAPHAAAGASGSSSGSSNSSSGGSDQPPPGNAAGSSKGNKWWPAQRKAVVDGPKHHDSKDAAVAVTATVPGAAAPAAAVPPATN